MADALKILAQANPAATTLTDMYTVGGGVSVAGSTLAICNRTSSTIQVRVAVAPGGATDDLKHYILYNRRILKNDSEFLTIGMTLSATDVVRVYISAVGVSFNLFGVEVT